MNRYYIDYNLKNGLGNPSVSLYLRGCDKPIKCEGCHNYELQDKSNDNVEISWILNHLISQIESSKDFQNELYLSILGGEPLTSYNIDITFEISKKIKEIYENITIILYSWRTIEQISSEKLTSKLKYIDYGVLGAYDKNKHIENQIPSSTNQYIYDFNKNKKIQPTTLKKG